MEEQFQREENLIGKEGIKKLHTSKVAIFGIGGVGSYVVEALARAGVENFVLVDSDKVEITNINRQLIATNSTIGKAKVEVAKQRILDINKNAKVEVYEEYFAKEKDYILDSSISYVVDAIDSINSKVELILKCKELNLPIISSMGTGNKLEPTKFEVADIYKTEVCPLAKIIRKKMKENNINSLKVVYSKEEPIKNTSSTTPSSISFVPSVAGLIIAGEVIKDIIK